MSTRRIRHALALALVLALLAPVIPACTPVQAANSFVALVPKVLHSNNTEAVSLTLTREDTLVPGVVEISLLQQDKEVLKVNRNINGKGVVPLNVPNLDEGQYEIRVTGPGFDERVPVKVENSFLVFLETDKPIYQPGQTVHIRALTLNSELKPVSEAVTIEAMDAKGIKVFRSEVTTDAFGMANLDLPLSEEPNLGAWKLTATSSHGKAQLDVQVEKYVLPKYEVAVELPKDWFLVNEPIQGKVKANYSFGKPVKGEVEIVASRYVGKWAEYARYTAAIDGEGEFQIPAAGYVAGVPAAGGMGNVTLDVTVKEPATGYEEKTSQLLTVTANPLNLQIIPEGSVFKPGLPFNFLIVTQSPDNKPVDTPVQVNISYIDSQFKEVAKFDREIATSQGKALVEVTPPENSVALTIHAFELSPISSRPPAEDSRVVQSSYSPSGNFIHVEQASAGVPKVGESIKFNVYSTNEAVNFYYEVISRGRVVFSDFTRKHEITVDATAMMAPSSRLLVYQILPDSEVAADYVPFDVTAQYPQEVTASFSSEEARPGDEVTINLRTDGESEVGLAAVDKSVFILAENRMNLQQVFDELEKLYMKPQAEIHDVYLPSTISAKGAQDIFQDAGMSVLTNNKVPQGKEYTSPQRNGGFGMPPDMALEKGVQGPVPAVVPAPTIAVPSPTSAAGIDTGLAEVQRVRQYFPETWLWQQVPVGPAGRASVKVTVPDSITTWMLRAVAVSKKSGLGIAEDQLTAFQPFFATIDLPYSAVRGEEFPIRVSVYNYLEKPQAVQVQIEKNSWFDLLDDTSKTINIAGNDIGGVQFNIRPVKIGTNQVKITVQSPDAADALVKDIIIEPEGVAREVVDTFVISGGKAQTVDTTIPPFSVADSGRAYIGITASYLAQTIEGLEGLIQMPFGCGEQNMIVFAPDVFIARYLKASGQLKPEVMAKAEKLMITGYQRELTYRRNDGSFSAFGQQDAEGSLWLSAFVLKSFAQAQDLIYIDSSVTEAARKWITSHQNADGSFDPVGFVHHQEMIGGMKGKTALTAYVAIALIESGDKADSARAVAYLEKQLAAADDPYAVALTSYALELAGSAQAGEAYQKLMVLAKEDENGLHWGEGDIISPELEMKMAGPMIQPPAPRTSDIETTGYATLALIRHGDALNASRAARWLVSHRNAQGGFGSTQDTVVALQALTEFAAGSRADVDLTVNVKAGEFNKQLKINSGNYDVLQMVDVPINGQVEISASGKGEAVAQVVTKYNLPDVETADDILKINVDYDAAQVEVNDLVTVSVNVTFNPPEPIEAGMIVLDVSVPTGFAADADSIVQAINNEKRIKRYDIAGRKVIFYINNMLSGDQLAFKFQVRAMYPVKAKAVASQAYSYYQPEIKGETMGQDITVK